MRAGPGELLWALPNATAVLHPRGAANLIDPTRLKVGARAVYGDQDYDCALRPAGPDPGVADHRRGGQPGASTLGRSRLHLLATPGHALHHLAIHDETAGAIFSGDVFGLSYRVFDNSKGEPFIFPTTSPTQFDPDQAHASIERIRAPAPGAVYLAHFSRVTGTDRLAADLHRDIDRFVELAGGFDDGRDSEESLYRALLDRLSGRLDAHGSPTDLETRETWLAMDVRLNAAGLLGWKRRVARTRAG